MLPCYDLAFPLCQIMVLPSTITLLLLSYQCTVGKLIYNDTQNCTQTLLDKSNACEVSLTNENQTQK